MPEEPHKGVYLPTVDEVGGFMHARTPDRYGNDKGTFDEDTNPTEEQAEKEIVDAYNEVSGRVSDLEQDDGEFPCIVRMRERAKSAVIIYAAMLIEIGYFPEETTGQFSPYDRLEKLYENKMKGLTESVAECIGGGGESVGGDAGTGMPSYNFDDGVPKVGGMDY